MFLLLCCLFFCFFLVFDNNDDTVHATYYYFIVGLVFYFSFCGSEKGPNVFWSFLFALVFVGFWNIIELWESLLVHGFWCSLTKFFAMHRMRSDLLVWSILAVKSFADIFYRWWCSSRTFDRLSRIHFDHFTQICVRNSILCIYFFN